MGFEKKSFAIANKMHLTYVKKNGLGFLSKCPWGGFVSWVRLSLGWVCLWGTFVPGVRLSLGWVCPWCTFVSGWVCPWGRFVPGVGLSLVYVCLGVGLSGVGLSGVRFSGVCSSVYPFLLFR